MATKKKGRTDDGDLETEDDDLEDEADDEETEDDDDTSDDEDEEEEGAGAKGKGTRRKETNEERLTRELAQAKKEARAERRKAAAAESKLAKAGITDKDDPADLKAQLTAAQDALSKRMAQDRATQAREAIREVLQSDDDYAPYTRMSKYILADMELSDDDIDPDTGEWDQDALDDAAEKAVAKFIKNAPKVGASVKEQEGGGAGGNAARSGAGGVPARGSGKDSRTKPKETEAERLARLDKTFGGVFTKTGLVVGR